MTIETRKKLFAKVSRHLKRQGVEASDEDGGCVFHASDGKKCAIGCLITKKAYKTYNIGIEDGLKEPDPVRWPSGRQPVDPVRRAVEVSQCVRLGPLDWELLEKLQSVHDETHPRKWEAELERVKRDFNL